MKSPIGSGVWGQRSKGCSPILLSVQGVQVARLSPGDPEGQSVRELKHNKEFPHCLAPPPLSRICSLTGGPFGPENPGGPCRPGRP